MLNKNYIIIAADQFLNENWYKLFWLTNYFKCNIQCTTYRINLFVLKLLLQICICSLERFIYWDILKGISPLSIECKITSDSSSKIQEFFKLNLDVNQESILSGSTLFNQAEIKWELNIKKDLSNKETRYLTHKNSNRDIKASICKMKVFYWLYFDLWDRN